MAYTPYNQALPDTSRYNIDPVLLERLYQPARQNPYQAGVLQEQNADYYADPFAYTNNKFGVGTSLDELLKKEGGAEGLFSSPLVSNAGGGDFGMQLSPDQIAFLDAETLDQRGARIKDDFAKLFNPIPSLIGMLSGPTRGVVNAPITNLDTYSPAAAQAASSNALSAAQASQQAQAQHGINSAQAQAAQAAQAQANAAANAAAISAAQSSGSSSDFGGDLGTGASDAAGFGGYGGVW